MLENYWASIFTLYSTVATTGFGYAQRVSGQQVAKVQRISL